MKALQALAVISLLIATSLLAGCAGEDKTLFSIAKPAGATTEVGTNIPCQAAKECAESAQAQAMSGLVATRCQIEKCIFVVEAQ